MTCLSGIKNERRVEIEKIDELLSKERVEEEGESLVLDDGQIEILLSSSSHGSILANKTS